jgi:flavin reductase (DIM6/NTAB) family NADH-FMN oxidoreductase RutF
MPALLVGTYCEDGTPNAMTAAWTGVCCQKPVCVGVAVRHNRFTYTNIERKMAFTLAVPSTDQVVAVDYLGMVSGKNEPGKVEIAGLASTKSDEVDAPILTDCPVNLACKLIEKVALGTHYWCIGEVMAVHVRDDLIGEDGNFNPDRVDPLVYITQASQYRSLGKVVGQAYSAGNKIGKKK